MRRESEGTFVSRDFQALSLFRIVISLYLLCDFYISVFPFFADFYGQSGVLPIDAMVADGSRPGLAVLLPFVKILNVLFPPTAFAAFYSTVLVTFATGYWTRLSNVLVFICNAFLFWRNPYLESGAETLTRLLLLWCIFLPLGRYWSVDGALDPEPRDRPYPMLPFLALRMQIASLYLFAALFKIAGAPWRDGVALTWSLSDDIFGATPAGLFVIHHASALLYWANYLVIGFQLAFPFLVYCPWRNDLVRGLALAGSAVMHGSFIVFLNVGGFPYVCLSMLILLVPDSWIDRLLRRRRERLATVAIFYEPGCGFCQRISLILRELLLSPTSAVLAASADPEAHRLLVENSSWVVRGADGRSHLKWHAMVYLLKQNPLFVLLAWLFDAKPLRQPLDRLYDLIGTSRRRLGPLAKIAFPLSTVRSAGRPALILCGFLMALAFLSNVFGILRLTFPSLRQFDQLTAVFQVRQSWEVFAPGPVHFRRDYRVEARTRDGAVIDVMGLLPRPIFQSRGGLGISFASPRWTKYFDHFDVMNEPAWSAFGQYLCRRAASLLSSGSAIDRVEIRLKTAPIDGTPPAQFPVIQDVFECTRPT